MSKEDNLQPFTSENAAEYGSKGGKNKKGSKHLSTWIQDLLTDEEFETYIQHPTKGWEPFKGAPIKAIVSVAARKAMAGDIPAMEWLAKHGYGQKLTIEMNDPTLTILHKFGLGENDARETEETTDTAPKSIS